MLFNLALLVAVIGLTINMVELNAKIETLSLESSYNNRLGVANYSTNQIHNQSSSNTAKKKSNRDLIINDQEYSPSGIQVYADEITTLKITNEGERSHSFIIDELNIDIDSITPGESKEIIIDKEFAQSKSYIFYSNAEGDDPQTFTCVLMVLK